MFVVQDRLSVPGIQSAAARLHASDRAGSLLITVLTMGSLKNMSRGDPPSPPPNPPPSPSRMLSLNDGLLG